ncbi:MAG: hypothetical protein P9X27_04230 [Candidatus Kaelpia aquatica]|nr:hypothetical protein [Candidatus Kaelpia aquatica]
MNKNKRKQFFANKFHKQIFFIIGLAALLPTIIVSIALYYLIFGIIAQEIAIPETIAYHIMPAAKRAAFIIFAVAPLIMLTILTIAHRITHSILGPYSRIIRELDENLEGENRHQIKLRKHDKFSPLVERINRLLEKIGIS